MEEAIALAQKIGGLSFATLLVLILGGSYFGIWVWGRELRTAEAKHAKDQEKLERERDEWKAMALDAAGILKTSVDIVKRRADTT